jgi:hypothetical protein
VNWPDCQSGFIAPVTPDMNQRPHGQHDTSQDERDSYSVGSGLVSRRSAAAEA